MKDHPLYPRQDAQALGRYYLAHVAGMTEADLYEKSDLCEQLAWRDKLIRELTIERDEHLAKTIAQREQLAAASRRLNAIESVATEAAAMLAETNHGGLSFARSASMQNALVAAHIPIPACCSACPHGPGPEWLYCPRGCRANHEPIKLVPGQHCPECREIAETAAAKLARVHYDAECYQAGWVAAMARSEEIRSSVSELLFQLEGLPVQPHTIRDHRHRALFDQEIERIKTLVPEWEQHPGRATEVSSGPPKCECKGTGTTVGPGGFRLCDACYPPQEQPNS